MATKVRTVEIDPERAPVVRFAFQAYATGDWSLAALLEELTERGLTNRATGQRPERPLHLSRLHKMLTNPYYIGVVTYRGEQYLGKHQPLITPDVFDAVQRTLHAHNQSGDRHRLHHHYLKGSLVCARCEARLTFTRVKGKGGSYDYFVCLGRHSKRTRCDLPYLPVREVEKSVLAHWRTEALEPAVVERIRVNLLAEHRLERREAGRLAKEAQARIDAIGAKRVRWAEKTADGVIPDDIGRARQNELTQQLVRAGYELRKLDDILADDSA